MAEQKKRRKAETEITLTPTQLLTNNIDDVQTFIMHIDVLLRDADAHLAKLQPPHGRIRIEWWKCPQAWAEGARCPTLVRWRLTGNRAWQAERLSASHLTSRAKRNGWFRETYEQVREVLDSVGKLITLRNRLTTLVSRHLMTVSALYQGNLDMLKRTEADLAGMGEWVKLKADGLLWAQQFPDKNPAWQEQGGTTTPEEPSGVGEKGKAE